MRFLKELRESKKIDGALVNDIYLHYSPSLQAIQRKYDRYRAENLPIHTREYGDLEPDIDAQLNNDFFGEIIDLKVAHFSGKPASYSYDSMRPEANAAYEAMSRFQVMNNLAYIDSQTTKDAAITGKAYRLLYINPDNELRVAMLKPHEVVVFYEHNPVDIEFAIRFYPVEDDEGKEIIRADVYTSTHMYEFVKTEDEFRYEDERLHQFLSCPVILYRNNDEELGDADKVLSLIDAYDCTTSDLNAEITAFRLAYFAFMGGELDVDKFKEMKKVGAFTLPEGTDAKFITKDIKADAINSHLDRLREDIYHFSNTPNLRDDSFGGNSSGVAMRYKMSSIEGKCQTFEWIKVSADMRMFKVAAPYFERVHKVAIDPYSIIVEHTRNVPIDLKEVADSLKAYIDMGLPLEAILPQIPFVDDPEHIMQLIEKEAARFLEGTERIEVSPVKSSDTKKQKTKEQEPSI